MGQKTRRLRDKCECVVASNFWFHLITWVKPPPYRFLYVNHAARAWQSYDLPGEGINLRITYILFFTTQGHGGPPRMSDQLNAGATSETAQTWKTINTKHTLSQTNKANVEWWLRRPNDIRGPLGPKVSWHLSYRRGTPRKNLIQETCPDRESNSCPLRDRRSCYHLFHSGGQPLTSLR